jgi:hypothetical protein
MAAFRAMIARWLRGGNDEVTEWTEWAAHHWRTPWPVAPKSIDDRQSLKCVARRCAFSSGFFSALFCCTASTNHFYCTLQNVLKTHNLENRKNGSSRSSMLSPGFAKLNKFLTEIDI